MKRATILASLAFALTSPAMAEQRVDVLCGEGHLNEVSASDDVIPNPDGYFIRSLQTQISHGDPRLVKAVGNEFHVCTRSAATPDMDANRVLLLAGDRVVTYLFVPMLVPTATPNS